MNNPRKFSDKIALLVQKQAEEAEAFEKILREVQPITSGNISETVSSCIQPKAHLPSATSETNGEPTWTKQNGCNTPLIYPSNQTSNDITNHTLSPIYSTNMRDCDEKLRSSDVPWKWPSNEALVPSLGETDNMAGYSSNFTISSEPLTSNPVSHNLVPEATKNQHSTCMAEISSNSGCPVSCHNPNSTFGFSQPKTPNGTNSFLQSNSISTTNQLPQKLIPLSLLHSQTHHNKIQTCDQLLEMLFVECDTTSPIS